MKTYLQWSREGNYNADKARAAWDFAENQKDEENRKQEMLLEKALIFIEFCRLEHNRNCKIPMMVPERLTIKKENK